MLRYTFLVFFYVFVHTDAAYEGDNCIKNGVAGTCVNMRNCPAAIADLKNRINPQICTFIGTDPVVCCVNDRPPPQPSTKPPTPVATPAPVPKQTTTEYIPPVYDYQSVDKSGALCDPIKPSLTNTKNGQKSWDKCIDYQQQLIFPCEKGVSLSAAWGRKNNCKHSAEKLIVGGADAAAGEFPHMALLGYGDDAATAQWLCGGTLISEKFILTAGHCTSSRENGPVTFVKLGNLKRSDPSTHKVYKVRRIIKHPDYKPPIKYNDIALLETEGTIELDQFTVPACLDLGRETRYDNASATGWGTLEYRGEAADTLQKVTLTKFSEPECQQKFPVSRLMKQGFDVKTQYCYGDHTMSKDTCQGDSGGPLQVKSENIFCMYVIIGVTSFGKACGFIGDPGIYTRVSNYVPWIESIVWA